MEIKKEVNDRVKHLRNVLDLTQAVFAKRIAISTSYLAGIEVGEKRVNERVMRLITHEYGVNEQWLKTGTGDIFNKGLDVSLAKMTAIFKSLSPGFQACAVEQIDTLSSLEHYLKSD